jgi:hypothetical protein
LFPAVCIAAPYPKFIDGKNLETTKEAKAMNAVEIQAHARKLYEAHGTKALAEAAQTIRALEERGDKNLAQDWRRIQSALQQLRGPNVS